MKYTALIILLSLTAINTRLTVFQPISVGKELNGPDHKGISYTIANFGHIPYGAKLIAPLVKTNPEDACKPLNPVDEDLLEEMPFFLIKRGNCRFTQKVQNAQTAGAKMAIIMDNKIEHSERITMGDDGRGAAIHIPSVFIKEEDGEKLLKALETHGEGNLVLVIDFDTKQTEKVSYNFWIDVSSRESLVTINLFNEKRNIISGQTKFQPIYKFFTKYSAREHNFQREETDCLGGGRYCALDPDGASGAGTGKHVAAEQLRQLCIFEESQDKWWNYVKQFQTHCINPYDYLECSKKQMQQIGVSYEKIEKCYEDNAVGSFTTVELSQNKLLDEQIEKNNYSGVVQWPGVTINNVNYHGNLQPDDIVEAICATLKNPNDTCKDILLKDKVIETKTTTSEDGVNVPLIVTIVIVILILFFLFMVLIYRRMVRKEMSSGVSTQVNQMVSQYIAFYESKDKKSGE